MTSFSLLQDFIYNSCLSHSDKTAIFDKERILTFKELYNMTNGAGRFLQDKGVKRGDRIAVLLDKSIEQILALFGSLKSDACFVLINPALGKPQIRHILTDCNVKILITADKFAQMVNEIKTDISELIVVYEDDFKNGIKAYYGEERICGNITDDICSIIYTSGSTGLPKGIVITHRNIIDGARIVSQYLNIDSNDRLLGLLPFNFDYGFNQLATTLYKGAQIELFQYFMPNTLMKTLRERKITGLAAIPSIWSSVFNPRLAVQNDDYDYPDLRYITNSGGKLPVTIVKQIREKFKKTKLFLMYGLTEAFRSTYLSPEELDKRPDSIGKAIPDVEVEVINSDGMICKPGEEGELIHRGACIARGYWNNPAKTAEVYKPNPLLPPENRFLETVVYSGDIVRKDEQGFLYFISRKDNMIKTSGYRVSPTEVEELILQFSGVVEVVVFGLSDPAIGQKIRAVVTVSSNIETKDIINFCKKTAPLYMVPQEIYIEETMPRTSTGKLDRPQIILRSREKYGD